MRAFWIAAVGVAALAVGGCANRCVVRSGERAEIFPTYGYQNPAKPHGWMIPVRGRIYEPNSGHLSTETWKAIRLVARLTDESEAARLLEERLQAFLAQAPSGRAVTVTVGLQRFKAEPTDKRGVFAGTLAVPAALTAGSTVAFALPTCDPGSAPQGQAVLLADSGRSVVSTIDDTIKETGLGNSSAVLANTLFREYRAVSGMPSLYRKWAEEGAAFHYITPAPWQLYKSIDRFLDEKGFPDGAVQMRSYEMTGDTILDKLDSIADMIQGEYDFKSQAIEELLQRFPHRTFILVGANSSHDPEIFGALARKYANRVEHIYIREINPAEKGRYDSAFEGIDAGRWTVFRETSELRKRARGAAQ